MKTLAWLSVLFLCLFSLPATGTATLLYRHGFETGNTSEFDRTVFSEDAVFTGAETRTVRKGDFSGRMTVTLLSQRAYVEEELPQAEPEVYVTCAFRVDPEMEIFSFVELLSLVGQDPSRPMASIVLDGDGLLTLILFGASGEFLTIPATSDLPPLERGRWYEIELHLRSMLHPDGSLYEVFLDGIRTVNLSGVSTQTLVTRVCYGQRREWLEETTARGTVRYDLCKGADERIGQEPDKAAVVLVDRSDAFRSAYEDYRSQRVKGFFDHVGLPYVEVDVSNRTVDRALLEPFDLIVLGQEGLGQGLTADEEVAIAGAVQDGAGLLCLDPWIDRYGALEFQRMIGDLQWTGNTVTTWIEVPETVHFITREQPADWEERRYAFSQPVPQLVVSGPGSNEVIARAGGGPVVLAGHHGQGRVCLWLVSNLLWDSQLDGVVMARLGHVNGFDDVLWRSIVWAARKPMAWFPIDRRYVALKVDDSRGRGLGGQPFDYLERASERLGAQVHVSLFLNAIDDDEAAVLRTLQQQGRADVSAHAFDGGDTDPNEQTAWHIYWDIQNDSPFTAAQLEERWGRVDDFFQAHGLSFSPVFAPSFSVAGVGNLPFLASHGIRYANMIHQFGTVAGTGINLWLDSAPFRQGIHALDTLAGGLGPFNVSSWANYAFWSFDYLVRFESTPTEVVADAEEAFENARRLMRVAYGSRYPMVLLTHEYLLAEAAFDLTEWDRFLERLVDLAQDEGLQFVDAPELFRIGRDYTTTRVLSYEKSPTGIRVLLEGDPVGSTRLEVWRTGDVRSYQAVPAFSDTHTVFVPGGASASTADGGGGGCGCAQFPAGRDPSAFTLLLGAAFPSLLVLGWLLALRYRRARERPLRRRD